MRLHAFRLLVPLLLFASAAQGAEEPPLAAATEQLTLAGAASEAASRGQALLVQRLEAKRAELGVPAASGAFLPVVVASATATDTTGPDLPADTALQSRLGVQYQAPFGTRAEVGVSHDLRDPTQGAGLSLGLSQPLLHGAGRDGTGAFVREAEVEARLARELYRGALDRFLAEVESAYWDLALAQADVTIRARSRDRARTQAEETAENIRRGLLAPTERYIVEESLNLFEQSLVGAEEARAQAASRLARLLERPAGAVLQAADALDTPRPADTLERVLTTGLTESPDLRAARLALERSHVRLAFDADQTLPALDLGATIQLNGFGEGAGGAFGALAPGNNRALSAGLTFSMPLLDSGFEAREARARLATQQQIAALATAEADLRYALADTLRGRTSRERSLALAREVVKLAELKLAAEREKYQSGLSTLADVVRFQRELDDALIAEQRALRTLRDDDTRLLRLQGVLHRARGLEVR